MINLGASKFAPADLSLMLAEPGADFGAQLDRLHPGPDLGAQRVDQRERALLRDVPERPAVARLEALRQRADAVDRADRVAERHRAVGAHQRLDAPLGVREPVAR